MNLLRVTTRPRTPALLNIFKTSTSVKVFIADLTFKYNAIFSRKFSPCSTYFNVVRLGCCKMKIFNSVVVWDVVDMMNDFFSGKISSNAFFHNKAMFSYIPRIIRKWMLSHFYEYVPILISHSSSFPSRVFVKGNISTHWMFHNINYSIAETGGQQ